MFTVNLLQATKCNLSSAHHSRIRICHLSEVKGAMQSFVFIFSEIYGGAGVGCAKFLCAQMERKHGIFTRITDVLTLIEWTQEPAFRTLTLQI